VEKALGAVDATAKGWAVGVMQPAGAGHAVAVAGHLNAIEPDEIGLASGDVR
jgi:hypothetical protein